MPPKKQSAKAIAAGQKKQNTIKAEEIVSLLKLKMGTPESASIVKKPDTKKAEKSVASDSSKKRSIQDDGIVAKSKRSRIQDKVSTVNTEAEATPKSTSIRTEPVSVGPLAELATNSETTKHVKTSSKSHGTTSSSKKSEKPSSTSKVADKNSARQPRARVPHGSRFQYEIDCKQVADSIDVEDLQKHLVAHLKVDGKKNNLGSTVYIHSEGHKVVIKSATFFPKKSLRFLSKKFLKKNWNIRVLSKNAHSYEYKYVGAP